MHYAPDLDIAASLDDILVNTVNTVGVMGKGVALAVKRRFPEIEEGYKAACESGRLAPGALHLAKTKDSRRVVNLATKKDWRDPSRPEWVGSGLLYLNMWLCRQPEPLSVTLPPPGAGNGGLDMADVQRMARIYLGPAEAAGHRITLCAAEEPLPDLPVIYAGVGSRDTPDATLALFEEIGARAAEEGWRLRSGGATGADTAFENGAIRRNATGSEIYLAEQRRAAMGIVGVRDVHERLVRNIHPAPDKLGAKGWKLMARNGCQVFGMDFLTPSSAVLCWTEGGKGEGGTGQAIRLANAAGIPVIDFGRPDLAEISAEEAMILAGKEVAAFRKRVGFDLTSENSPSIA